jgi:hypothetical protein
MSAPKLLRALGVVDVGTGIAGLAAAGWFGDQLGLGATTIRIVAGVLLVLGVDTLLMADRPFMAKVAIVSESVSALAALDLALFGDATGLGLAILVATAIGCAAVTVELVLATRTRSLVAA